MIQTTLNSVTVFLLNDEPDWSTHPVLKVSLPDLLRRGLTGRETRRPLADALRCSLSYGVTLDQSAANALRDALQLLGSEAVVCPAWPFAIPGADWSGTLVTGGLLIGWMADWSDFEIGASLADPTDWDYVAPLLYGRLDQIPDSTALGTVHLQLTFDFEEDGDAGYAITPDAVTFDNGAALPDATVPKRFPFEIEWTNAPTTGAAEKEIERVQLANKRITAPVFYPQNSQRPVAGNIILKDRTEIAELLRWFLDRHGSAEAHYIAEQVQVARLASTAIAGTPTIVLDDATQIGTNRYIELRRGDTVEIVRITSISVNTCTLSANLANTWTASNTLVRLAMLARHARDEISLEFLSPTVARASLAWREVPDEYSAASGETRGTTLGKLTTEADIYTVTLDFNGATEIHRFTSFERDLAVSGNVHTARVCEHTDIRETINLDRDELTLSIRWWANCPFRKFLPNQLDCRVLLVIARCEVSGSTGSSVSTLFTGEITGVTADGPMLSLTAAGDNALFDRHFPGLIMQPGCNRHLFDAGCALVRATWTITSTVHAISGKTLTLDFSASGSLPSGFGFAHWLALGYTQRTISGLPVRQIIFDSAAISSNRIALTMGSVPTPTPVFGDSVSVIPACDGLAATCQAYHASNNPTGKFNNYSKFLGFKFMPDKNPAFTPLRKTDSTTGKK